MEVQLEDLGPCRKRLKITVPSERVLAHLETVYKQVNKQVSMKGFRQGKIPKHVLKQRMGPQIMAEAKESLIQETFQEAMKEKDLNPVGSPKLDVSEEALSEGKELAYSVELDLKPEFKVGKIKDINLRRQDTSVSDDDIDKALEQLAQSKRKLGPSEDPVAAGDFAKVDMIYKHEGEEVVRKEGLQINSKIPVLGTDPEEFSARLIGQKAGQSISLPITFPDSFEKEELKGKTGELELVIHEVIRFIAPQINDEMAKLFDFDSLDALKSDLQRKIGEQKKAAESRRLEDEVLDCLYAESNFEIPESLVQEEAQHRLAQLKDDLTQRGMPEEEIKKNLDAAKDEAAARGREGLRNLFLIEAIAKKEKVFVTETLIQAEIKRIAAENETTPEEAKSFIEEKGLMSQLRMDLMDRKVREFLRETATITDSES